MYRIIGADGREYGPVPADLLRAWIAQGRANAQTKALAAGATEWRTLGALPEFSHLFAITGAPQAAFTGTRQKSNVLAATGLILGILSLTVGLCCCYGLPFNILGLIFSLIALNQIRSNSELYDGQGMAIAGLISSILSLLLAAGLMIIGGLAAGWGNWFESR